MKVYIWAEYLWGPEVAADQATFFNWLLPPPPPTTNLYLDLLLSHVSPSFPCLWTEEMGRKVVLFIGLLQTPMKSSQLCNLGQTNSKCSALLMVEGRDFLFPCHVAGQRNHCCGQRSRVQPPWCPPRAIPFWGLASPRLPTQSTASQWAGVLAVLVGHRGHWPFPNVENTIPALFPLF